ncbi:hypothetical protein D3C73_1597330 [compost metagenome]
MLVTSSVSSSFNGFCRSLSQISRGSKLIAESMVNTTTRPKNRMPGRGSISASAWNFTSDATRATTMTSSIDQ